jgi:hypothetical protein
MLLLYRPHGGPFVSVDLFALATLATRADKAMGPPPTKFYALRDNLPPRGGVQQFSGTAPASVLKRLGAKQLIHAAALASPDA